MSAGMIHATRATLTPPEMDPAPPVELRPQAWQDTRWLGEISGYTTGPDLFAGAWLQPEARRTISRLYAAACADLAQATLGGLSTHSQEWERWFAALRATARQLSPAQAGNHVVRRALHHGQRLEGAGALWGHQLRRGFAALLAATLPDPVPALIGENLGTFQAHDAAWLVQEGGEEHNSPVDTDALTPQIERNPSNTCSNWSTDPLRWPIAALRPNPLNPRGQLDPTDIEQLADSIVAQAAHGGILQPLLVTPDGTVVAGHRRLAAARRAGLADVPVIVRALSPIEQLEIQLTENLQRSELSPIEEGRAYGRLIEAGSTLARIARSVGVPASRVRERLTLLDLDERVQDRVHRGELPLRVGLALVPLRDQVRQRRLATIAVRRRLTVVQVRQLVEHALSLPPLPPRPAPFPSDDEPGGGGLSATRLEALEALRADGDRTISFGQLAELAHNECGACGLESAPTVCAECPNLHLLHAVLRHGPRNAA
jgi:ParB family chromosome partitioning protein